MGTQKTKGLILTELMTETSFGVALALRLERQKEFEWITWPREGVIRTEQSLEWV